jgi:hypothetical protein
VANVTRANLLYSHREFAATPRVQTIALWQWLHIVAGSALMIMVLLVVITRQFLKFPILTAAGWLLLLIDVVALLYLEYRVRFLVKQPNEYWANKPLPRWFQN